MMPRVAPVCATASVDISPPSDGIKQAGIRTPRKPDKAAVKRPEPSLCLIKEKMQPPKKAGIAPKT